jgi:hypothetical protein
MLLMDANERQAESVHTPRLLPAGGHRIQVMGAPIEHIEWIDSAACERLAALGVHSTEDLLDRARTPESRARLAYAARLPEGDLKRWLRLADLMRLPGLRDQQAALLAAAGFESPLALRDADPHELVRRLRRLNVELTLARAVPSESQLAQWVALAQTLEPAVAG